MIYFTCRQCRATLQARKPAEQPETTACTCGATYQIIKPRTVRMCSGKPSHHQLRPLPIMLTLPPIGGLPPLKLYHVDCVNDSTGEITRVTSYPEPEGRARKVLAGMVREGHTFRLEPHPAPLLQMALFTRPSVTDWFPMKVMPCADRPGYYDVEHKMPPASYVSREYWDGKNWPGLVGKFSAVGWRGEVR